MRKWLILFSALSTTAASGAPAWTWVDNSGQVHYSDRPVPGARQVELAGAPAPGGPVRSTAPGPSTAGQAREAPPAATTPYRTFNVVSPGQQETLWNLGGTLNVQVALEPGLQPGHRLDVFLDGQRKNLNATSTQLTVPEVFRGIHSLQAIVIDSRGEEVLRSLATTFMVQQASTQNPNSPLAQPRANPGGN
jgi:hypothetical protein